MLHTSGLAEPSLLALTSGPARLIFRLYEHPSITERVRHYSYLAPTSSPPYSTLVVAGVPDIHAVVDRIASIASVDASKVRRTLRDQWLVSSAGQWRFLNSNWNRLHPFNGPLSGTTRTKGTRKVKPIWIFLKQETVASAGPYASLHLTPDNHASTPPLSFLQAGCPSCRPTNSVKALKAKHWIETDCKVEIINLS